MEHSVWLSGPNDSEKSTSSRFLSFCEKAVEAQSLEQLEKSFNKSLVKLVLREHSKKTTQEVFQLLQVSLQTRATLHGFEMKMDKHSFARRMCSGHWTSSGKDKTGRPIMWLATGKANRGRRSLVFGSKTWYSTLRAELFIYEIHWRAAIAAGNFIGLTFAL